MRSSAIQDDIKMVKAIFLKEFHKIRWFWVMIFLLNAMVSIQVFISTRRLFILDHPEIVWYQVLQLGHIPFDQLRYLPVFSGLLIACAQYLPEMWGERLRLSLHLPMPPHLLMLLHLGVGLLAYCLVISVDIGVLWWTTRFYFPRESMATNFFTAFPWFIAGVAGYLGGTLALLEPCYRQKLLHSILTLGVSALFLKLATPGSYAMVFVPLMLFPVLMTLSVMLPVYRFRYRKSV